jgi:Polyphosphate kinase 2 (PPK2)
MTGIAPSQIWRDTCTATARALSNKFYLHLSKEEQRKRFLQRIDEPEKNWKFSLADVEERKFWREYVEVYEQCLSQKSTRDAPWYVVPADDKQNARLIVSALSSIRSNDQDDLSENERGALAGTTGNPQTAREERVLSAPAVVGARGRRPRSASA